MTWAATHRLNGYRGEIQGRTWHKKDISWLQDYLKSTATIGCDNQLIVEKARNLTEGASDTTGKVRDLFRFARDKTKYNTLVLLEVSDSHRTSKKLERGEGFCVGQAAAVATIARVVDIPARFHFVGIRNHLAPSPCSRL